jgi:polysaccharide biosynthesis protein PslG
MNRPGNRKNIVITVALFCMALISALSTAEATTQSSPTTGPNIPGTTPASDQFAGAKIDTPNAVMKYGFLMSLISNNSSVRSMGFGWVSYGIFWSDEEPSPGQYSWLSGANNVDNIADGAKNANVNILIRISRTPAWARDSNCSAVDTCPPANAADFGTFAGALAARVRSRLNGQQVAYEIWNEPNTDFEWGGLCPDPVRYTGLLRAAYPRIKAVDSGATVAGGALTTVAEVRLSSCHMDDLTFLQGMYNAGAAPYFDVLADHPYGFISTPEADPITSQSGLLFRRAERHHAYMVANGDGNKQIWATEMGWAINPSTEGYNCPAGDVQWYQIYNQQQQADYLVRAYQWAKSYWPWMGAMFTWNYDFDEAPWYAQCNSFRFFAVKNRLAKTALQNWVLNPPPTYTPAPTTPIPTSTPSATATPVDAAPVISDVRYSRLTFTRDGGPLSIDLDAHDLDSTGIDSATVQVTYPNSTTQLLQLTLTSGSVYSGTWHTDFTVPPNTGSGPVTYNLRPYVVEAFPPRRTVYAATQHITVANTRFWDVPTNFWAYPYIDALATQGAIAGYADGSFQPGNNATRAQLSKIVVLAFALPLLNPAVATFEDVQPGSTFYQYVETAAARNLVNGYPCGGTGEPCGPNRKPYFRPGNFITRAQIAKIVVAAAGWTLLNPLYAHFQDVPRGSTFYQSVETAVAYNILSGYPCGSAGEPCGPGNLPYFRPNANATRAQISKIVYLASTR